MKLHYDEEILRFEKEYEKKEAVIRGKYTKAEQAYISKPQKSHVCLPAKTALSI